MTAPMPPERLDEIRERDEGDADPVWAFRDRRALLTELDRLHSWHGLMSLLDEHWPDWLFITKPDPEDYHEPLYREVDNGEFVRANPGVIITGLIRWVDRLRAQVESVGALADRLDAAGWVTVYETGSEIAEAIRAALASGGDR